MLKRKLVKEKGKIKFSKYFQEFKEGEKVAVIRELSLPVNFPKNIQGRTGIIERKRGKAYMVRIKDQNREKKYLIEPIHLKKIK